MACRVKDEYQRHYTVTEPRSHPKGYTEYKVTAKFVSKTKPEDVKEVTLLNPSAHAGEGCQERVERNPYPSIRVLKEREQRILGGSPLQITVWKRYSDFKKLHGDLSYIHRNLFRRMEEFPAFPKAQVFGRFEPEVIEERRKAAEAMLRFTVHIPALNNSPQLKEFFRGGEVKRPLEACDLRILPPPLIPVPQEGTDAGDDARRSVAELGRPSLEPEGEPEPHRREQTEPQSPVPRGAVGVAGEEHNREDEGEETGDPALAAKSEEDLDLLFASVGEEEKESGSPLRGPLSDQDLALFDPFIKEEQCSASLSQGATLALGSELLPGQDIELAADALWDLQISQPAEQEAIQGLDPGGYLAVATEEITLALKREAAKDYAGALCGYRNGVDILLKGVQGDPDPARREAVKKKTAEYLHRAEELVQLHLTHLQP
ncbi:sorting nexin-15 isoform X2 [Lepidochelys kempii]|uniref:sorting nexin-15 isoform X2 n=1 Tax=Lepidochelys kempii TaxID=8472 RepID=UPI003C6F0992